MTTPLALALVLITLVMSGSPAPADASGIKIIIGGPAVVHPPGHRHPPRPAVGPRPIVVWPHPVYVVQPRRCLVPGYWAYTWVPQSYAYNVWVDGQYSPSALWVEGHWEPRLYTTGYYQPYWVPERWADC